jgi:broad specificity phosphatase PhoE
MQNASSTKTIYLIRHGQTYGNAQGNWIGKFSQDKLNEYGRKQMRDVIDSLKKLNVYTQCVYSSPTTRALESAEIIQRHYGMPISIKKLNSLSEINLGILEDKTRDEGVELVPEEINDWMTNLQKFSPPLGESALEALERFSETVELIARNCTEQNIKASVGQGNAKKHRNG